MNFKRSQLAVALAASLALGGCFGSSNIATDVPDVVIPPPVSTTIDVEVTGNVIDSITGDAIDGATLTFLVNGESTNEPRLLDTDFTRISDLTAADGAFAFGFDSETLIDSVTILVEADGYLSQTLNFDIANAGADNALAFPLVAEATPGLAVTETVATLTGATTEVITIEANATTGGTTVSVPTGVELRNAAGEAVTGAINFQVVAVDSDDAGDNAVSVAELLPAGLQEAGSADVFQPIAATVVKFTDANGNPITQFSAPITITMRIPSSRGVAQGDTLALKSYDDDTGVWTTETEVVTIGAEVNGFFPGSFEIDHLTVFAAGRQVANDACTGTTTSINFTGDAAVAGLVANVTRSASGSAVRTLADAQAQLSLADTASASETASVRVTDTQGRVWGSVNGATACGTINVPLLNPGDTVSESLNVTAVCQEDNTVFTADTNAIVTYRIDGSTDALAQAAHVGGGDYRLVQLTDGATYAVNVNPSIVGVPNFSGTITADGTDEAATIDYNCSAATGTGGTGGTGTGGTGGTGGGGI